MPAAYQDLYLEQGATFSLQLTVDDISGAAFGLNGARAVSQIKKSYTSNAIATFVTTLDVNNSRVNLNLDAANTSSIPSGKYVYDTILSVPPDTIGAANVVFRLLEGRVTVSPGVSRF